MHLLLAANAHSITFTCKRKAFFVILLQYGINFDLFSLQMPSYVLYVSLTESGKKASTNKRDTDASRDCGDMQQLVFVVHLFQKSCGADTGCATAYSSHITQRY